MTVAKEPGHRGEHEISRKTIVCGNAGLFRWTCGDYSCAFYLCTRGCGCTGHPAFPTPSFFLGGWFMQNSGESRRGIANLYLAVIAKSTLVRRSPAFGRRRMRRSNPAFYFAELKLDCFAEPVIGRRFAPTRWLAMTVLGGAFARTTKKMV